MVNPRHAIIIGFLLGLCATQATGEGTTPDWTENAELPPEGQRRNIFLLDEYELEETRWAGLHHALQYPVTTTGLIPHRPIAKALSSPAHAALGQLLAPLIGWPLTVNSMAEHYEWMGLTPYPSERQEEKYALPRPSGSRPGDPLGAALVETGRGTGLTLSCAACHSSTFFGKSVMGLSNRRLRVNDTVVSMKAVLPYISDPIFAATTGASMEERALFADLRSRMRAIGAVNSRARGLDTSLAQVSLSLSRRNQDAYASRNRTLENHPRPNLLTDKTADSKPSVWWSMKYKTRWLSDGSLVSGNPVFTNLLWNEIGRGSDLKILEQWMRENHSTIHELTAAVFATPAPAWGEFFSPERIDLAGAKRGEKLFEETCSSCHGSYHKAWSTAQKGTLQPLEEQVRTLAVSYPTRTKVVDVGTDPGRFEAMEELAPALNALTISQWMQTRLEPQQGYVAPPLEGLFTRYPYFHNNSIPNLCALLTAPEQRPVVFYQGPAQNTATDFDFDCVGYPTGSDIPTDWQNNNNRVDTRLEGLSNAGHYAMLLNEDGAERYNAEEKRDLIEFLKTL